VADMRTRNLIILLLVLVSLTVVFLWSDISSLRAEDENGLLKKIETLLTNQQDIIKKLDEVKAEVIKVKFRLRN